MTEINKAQGQSSQINK